MTSPSPSLVSLLASKQYQIVKKIGSGHTADVYLIESRRWQDSKFALKQVFLHPGLSVRVQEMPILCTLSHPNVINLYDYFEADNYGYLILEFCAGGSLMDLLTSAGHLSREELIYRCREIASGLAYCHSRGIAHGDIKPHNILIDGYNRCKLADFGLSQQIDPNTASTQFLGSMAFMAPEVLGRRAFDPFVADIWALGVTFFWMARGCSPFPLKDAPVFQRIIQCGLPPQDRSVMRPKFFRLIRQMVEPDPEKRISIQAVLQDQIFNVDEGDAQGAVKKLSEGEMTMLRSGTSMIKRKPVLNPRSLRPVGSGLVGSEMIKREDGTRQSQGSLWISMKNFNTRPPTRKSQISFSFQTNVTNVE